MALEDNCANDLQAFIASKSIQYVHGLSEQSTIANSCSADCLATGSNNRCAAWKSRHKSHTLWQGRFDDVTTKRSEHEECPRLHWSTGDIRETSVPAGEMRLELREMWIHTPSRWMARPCKIHTNEGIGVGVAQPLPNTGQEENSLVPVITPNYRYSCSRLLQHEATRNHTCQHLPGEAVWQKPDSGTVEVGVGGDVLENRTWWRSQTQLA
jgi:hypothetical protein